MTPALRALDLIVDQVRALQPGAQEERFVRHCVPGNRGPDLQVGAEVIRDLPPPCWGTKLASAVLAMRYSPFAWGQTGSDLALPTNDRVGIN
jgi:hypothetical protein